MKKPKPSCKSCVHFGVYPQYYCGLTKEYSFHCFVDVMYKCYKKPWKYYQWDGSTEDAK